MRSKTWSVAVSFLRLVSICVRAEKNIIHFQSPKNPSTLTRIHLEDMNLQLMREFEEFEGLGAQVVDDATITMENEDDDPSFRPAQASLLTSNDIYYEVWYILVLKSINSGKLTLNMFIAGQKKFEDHGVSGHRQRDFAKSFRRGV